MFIAGTNRTRSAPAERHVQQNLHVAPTERGLKGQRLPINMQLLRS